MPNRYFRLYLGIAIVSLSLIPLTLIVDGLSLIALSFHSSVITTILFLFALVAFYLAFPKNASKNVASTQVTTKKFSEANDSVGYIPALDGLRAIAVLMVFLSHFWFDKQSLLLIFNWGRIGVILFFVISGYLITSILLNNRKKSNESTKEKWSIVKGFYARRFIRIFPVYYFTIFIAFVMGHNAVRETIWWLLTYTVNIGTSFFNANSGRSLHFWSLCVEEQFYLIFPFLVLFLSARSLKYSLYVLIVTSLIYKYLGFFLGISYSGLVFSLFGTIDSLAVGALYALFMSNPEAYQAENRLVLRLYTVLGPVLLIGLQVWRFFGLNSYHEETPFYIAFSDLGVAMCSILAIHMTITQRTSLFSRFLSLSPLRYIGKISYSAYVYHMFVLLLALNMPNPQRLVVATVLSLALASISWHLFEARFNQYKDKFPYLPRREAEKAADIQRQSA